MEIYMEQLFLTESDLDSILKKLPEVRIGVVGYVCLDLYWFADMKLSTLSRETPHYNLPVVTERWAPGAAGNVVQNLSALGLAQVEILSIVGNDWRGNLLDTGFRDLGLPTDSLIRDGSRVTPAYIKPNRMGISNLVYEDPRIDFVNYEPISRETEQQVIETLMAMAGRVDILAVSDQLPWGVVTGRVRRALEDLGKQGLKIVVDSRDQIHTYRNVIIKPNEYESAAALGRQVGCTVENYIPIAGELTKLTGAPVVVTLGALGSVWADGHDTGFAPSVPAAGPIDIVGAGDTFLSAFCAAAATGCGIGQAAAFANLASGVTVKKIHQTGTATPEEIRAKRQEQTT